MSTNADLATIFAEMSALLELLGANAFRVNAHANVARVLRDLTVDVAELADEKKKLVAIEGVGDGSAKKIIEYVRTGRVAEHEKLLADVPRGLLDVLALPGLGPKTVRALWEQAEITDLASLEAAIRAGTLEGLPRMGAKTIRNIEQAIEFAARAARRTRLGRALPVAESIVETLAAVDGVTRVRCAGSLRRGRETIGDVDILAAATDAATLGEAFCAMPAVARVLAAGPTKCSVRLESGLQVDLRIVDEAVFGAALLYFTGSKRHNVVLRERAARAGLRLNEYGLFPDDGEEAPPQTRGVPPVAADTEQAIYAALDLPWIPPELREDRGEFEFGDDLPALVELGDIRSELHAHTRASDGRLTIEQLAAAAAARGFHTVAVTDHSQSSIQANGLSPERLRAHVRAVREADARIDGIRILAGTEVDILADGHLDYDDELLAELDIVVASPHTALRQDPEEATARLVRAVSHPHVHILGHPTGRMLGRREGLHPDMRAVVAAAAEHDTALEINANELRLDLRDVHVQAAVEAGALVSINCDTHRAENLDQFRYGVLTARRGRLTAARCLNTWPRADLLAWLARKSPALAAEA